MHAYTMLQEKRIYFITRAYQGKKYDNVGLVPLKITQVLVLLANLHQLRHVAQTEARFAREVHEVFVRRHSQFVRVLAHVTTRRVNQRFFQRRVVLVVRWREVALVHHMLEHDGCVGFALVKVALQRDAAERVGGFGHRVKTQRVDHVHAQVAFGLQPRVHVVKELLRAVGVVHAEIVARGVRAHCRVHGGVVVEVRLQEACALSEPFGSHVEHRLRLVEPVQLRARQAFGETQQVRARAAANVQHDRLAGERFQVGALNQVGHFELNDLLAVRVDDGAVQLHVGRVVHRVRCVAAVVLVMTGVQCGHVYRAARGVAKAFACVRGRRRVRHCHRAVHQPRDPAHEQQHHEHELDNRRRGQPL